MRLVLLSDRFFVKYAGCKEILQKKNRPYLCLEIRVGGAVFAIPFRHHIPHEYAFFTIGGGGLDYTKAIVVTDKKFISSVVPRVNQTEFNALKGREKMIQNGMGRYIKLYKKATRYKDNKHYHNIFRYSSLQYFNEYL